MCASRLEQSRERICANNDEGKEIVSRAIGLQNEKNNKHIY